MSLSRSSRLLILYGHYCLFILSSTCEPINWYASSCSLYLVYSFRDCNGFCCVFTHQINLWYYEKQKEAYQKTNDVTDSCNVCYQCVDN